MIQNRLADRDHFNADPDPSLHFNADPDPTFHFNADPDPTFHFNADPDPALYQSECESATTVLYKSYRPSILSLHASIASVHGPPWLRFEPLSLLNFDFNADPDPAFHSNAG
jgi:hypothetical protein